MSVRCRTRSPRRRLLRLTAASLSSGVGEVRMPSGKVAKPDITDNKDGTVTVKYAPTEAGLHEMDIKYDGIHIPGTTLRHAAAT